MSNTPMFPSAVEPLILGAALLTDDEYTAARPYINNLGYQWWLQTPGMSGESTVMCVNSDGSINEYGQRISDGLRVRPALQLSPSLARKRLGTRFLFAQRVWITAPGGLAVCETDLGLMIFVDYYSKDTSYTRSKPKLFLDAWWDKHKNDTVYKVPPCNAALSEEDLLLCIQMGSFAGQMKAAGLLKDPGFKALLEVLKDIDTNGATKKSEARLRKVGSALLKGVNAQKAVDVKRRNLVRMYMNDAAKTHPAAKWEPADIPGMGCTE